MLTQHCSVHLFLIGSSYTLSKNKSRSSFRNDRAVVIGNAVHHLWTALSLREDKGRHSHTPGTRWSWMKSDRWKLFEKRWKKEHDRTGGRKESEGLLQVRIQAKRLKEEGGAELAVGGKSLNRNHRQIKAIWLPCCRKGFFFFSRSNPFLRGYLSIK